MHDIIVIGSATRDAFFEGVDFALVKNSGLFKTGSGICLNLGSKIEIPKITFTTGGAGTNAAVTFSRQGFKTAAIVRVGNDVSGEEIRRGLLNEKTDCSMVQADKFLNTAYSVIFLDKSGERTILSFKGCGKFLSEKEIPWRKLNSRWIYVDSLQGNEKLLRKIIDCGRKNEIKLAANPGLGEIKIFKKNPELLSAFDVFVLNQEEASFLTGIGYQKEKEIFQKLNKLVQGIVCMTKGHKGSVVSAGKNLWRAGVYKERAVIDRTGAGDAFASGFVAGLLKSRRVNGLAGFSEKDIEKAIKFGGANSTSVVEYIGAKTGILTPAKFKARKWGEIKIIRM